MTKKDEGVAIKFYAPEQLRNEFKAECIRRGKGMGSVLEEFMRRFIEAPDLFLDANQPEETIAQLIQENPNWQALATNSYITLQRLDDLAKGAYPTNRELLWLARMLHNQDGTPRSPNELKKIRDRTFPEDHPGRIAAAELDLSEELPSSDRVETPY